MKDPVSSLDQLHDLAVPSPVSWWPLAPGWYVVLTVALMLLLFIAWKAYQRWRANEYRRVALRELELASDVIGIVEILRRTALVIAPREVIAGMSGREWLDWLAAHGPDAIPDGMGAQLTSGVYAPSGGDGDITSLRSFVHRWVSLHPSVLRDA